MRTTVIPAQITTVEDKIVGSLTLSQIFILLIPVLWTTLVFGVLPPTTHLAWYKIPLILFVLVACLILSLRIKGKVVINWLVVILQYNLRPQYYLFDKNDTYLRDIEVVEKVVQQKPVAVKKEIAIAAKKFTIKDLKELEKFIHNPNYTFSLKPDKKGGLYVAVAQIQK